MIIGHRVEFAGVVSDQTKSSSVEALQKILVKIAQITGNKDYDPYYGGKYRGTGGSLGYDNPGKVGFYTVSALAMLTLDGVVKIPHVSGFLGSVKKYTGGILDVHDRIRDNKLDSSLELGWDAWKATDPASLKAYVIDPIRDGAAKIEALLRPVAAALPSTAPSTGKPKVRAWLAKTAETRITAVEHTDYPGGTVAIFDPAIKQYRLLTRGK